MQKGNRTILVLKDVAFIALVAFVFGGTLVISRILLYQTGFAVPRIPNQADESTAIYYLFSGSLMLVAGIYSLLKGSGGAWYIRFMNSFLLMFLGFAVAVTIESSIYSDVPGYNRMILVLFLPALVFAILISTIHGNKGDKRPFKIALDDFLSGRPAGNLAARLMLAIVSFPVVYFVFGVLASPFVAEYYEELVSGLALPEPATIVGVQFLRSILFLFFTIPVMIYWKSGRASLVLSLGMAHFVMVFAYDIVLAIEMPTKLILIHGVEILLDSFVYSWLVVKLLYNKPQS